MLTDGSGSYLSEWLILTVEHNSSWSTSGSSSYESKGETVAPGQSSNHPVDAIEGENMTVMLDVQPPTVPMNVVVEQISPEDRGMAAILATANFSGSTSLYFTANNDDEIGIIISNRGQEQATANIVAGAGQVFADAEPGKLPTSNMPLALGVISATIAGLFLLGIGLVVIIVGAIIWLIDKSGRGKKEE